MFHAKFMGKGEFIIQAGKLCLYWQYPDIKSIGVIERAVRFCTGF